MSAVLGLIGLGMRAGHLVVGVDAVRSALQAGKVLCVVVANDATPRTSEKVVRLAQAKGVPMVQGPEARLLGERLGRPPVMVVGIRDRALAAGVQGAAAARQ